jgi:hypothetical protein
VNGDAGDVLNRVGAAGELLDIDGRIDINACIQEFKDILIPFRVASPGGIGMREFVDDDQMRLPSKYRIYVHFGSWCAIRGYQFSRDLWQAVSQSNKGFGSVGFNRTNDYVASRELLLLGRLQHGMRLANSRCHAKKDA